MKRIVIIGTSGSGKTTLGKLLSTKLNLPLTDLDDLYWLPNWKTRPKNKFLDLLSTAVKHKSFIICGNQSKYRTLIWSRADTIIWLDLPFFLLFWRVLVRGIKTLRSQEPICNGNRQTLLQLLWNFYWVIKPYFRRKRVYSSLAQTVTHAQWIHLTTRKEVSKFVTTLI